MDTIITKGETAPDFTLPDLDEKPHSLREARGRVVILNFWSAECPHAERADRELTAYLQDWGEAVLLLSIASNANEPLDLLRRAAAERGIAMVLHDARQEVADLYRAVTTPHLFVIDAGGILRYQGAFDDDTFRQRAPTQAYLKQAVEAVLAGNDPEPAETQPYGCTVVRFKPD